MPSARHDLTLGSDIPTHSMRWRPDAPRAGPSPTILLDLVLGQQECMMDSINGQ